jgi:hypothetical protein
LQVVVVGEKGGVSGGPEKKGGDERITQKVGAKEKGPCDSKKCEGIEDLADPEAVSARMRSAVDGLMPV